MPRLRDRLASLERRHAPPAPPPLVAYLDVAADFEKPLDEQYADAVAVLPVTPTVEEWEMYAIRQQAESAAHARERIRALGVEPAAEVMPDNVLPLTR